ncbi:hypothetical protein N329_07917, partial [Haliaeetus albicilla]
CKLPHAIRQCLEPALCHGDSGPWVYPPPVAIVFPGPILSSCPQESFVGTSAPMEIGSSFGCGRSL